MKAANIAFNEHLLPFHDKVAWAGYKKVVPSGMVPYLKDGDTGVWDSLAIVEYVAERHDGVWPKDPAARAFARSAAAEMHSGFSALRTNCGMNVGVRVKLREQSDALKSNLSRLDQLWAIGLDRFGGPFLAGQKFTAVDAFFCPVAFRVQSYGLKMDQRSMAYVQLLLDQPAMKAWYRDGIAEAFRDPPHDAQLAVAGTVIEDLRAPEAR